MRCRIPIASTAAFLAVAAAASAQTSWKLLWSDEFNSPANSTPDLTKWTYDLGNNNGWGNREAENYTSLPENAHMDGNGHLVIHVASTAGVYTSARLKTQGLFSVQYGRIEARIKLPSGQGIWPAFWMLGSDIGTAGWPQCGEIDIMENIGKEPATNHGSLHGPGYSGGNPRTATYVLPGGAKFSSDFHTFAIQWSQQAISFFVDGNSYETVARSAIPAGTQWVFDHPFFLLLNVAVGGTFPGPPDPTTMFPQDMLVDYVRVYQATSDPAPAIGLGGVVDVASYGSMLAPGSLASVFGTKLGPAAAGDPFDAAMGAFRRELSGTSVFVNGAPAALTYVSANQINFQVPWETLTGMPLNVEVWRDGVLGNPVPVTLSPAAPSLFAASGATLLTCTGGAPGPGSACNLWGNGFGATSPPQQNGIPSSATVLAATVAPCRLFMSGVEATVKYCGAAPGLIIYQISFVFPSGVTANNGTVQAAITVNDTTAAFVISLN